jgi:hypothetical protein
MPKSANLWVTPLANLWVKEHLFLWDLTPRLAGMATVLWMPLGTQLCFTATQW